MMKSRKLLAELDVVIKYLMRFDMDVYSYTLLKHMSSATFKQKTKKMSIFFHFLKSIFNASNEKYN